MWNRIPGIPGLIFRDRGNAISREFLIKWEKVIPGKKP
jgi:hypothetical protein